MILFAYLSLAQIAYTAVPLSTKVNDLQVGSVTLCTNLLLCGSMGTVILQTGSLSMSVTFPQAFTTIPNVFIAPQSLSNQQLTQLSFQCSVNPGLVTITGFMAQVNRYDYTQYNSIQLQYLATINANIKIQTHSITSYNNSNYQTTLNFAQTYSETPYVYGVLTRFLFTQKFHFLIGTPTLTGVDLQLLATDFTSQLSVSMVVFSRGLVSGSKFFGIQKNQFTIVPSALSTVITIQNLNYCISETTNQLLYSFRDSEYLSQVYQQYSLTATPYNVTNCSWSVEATLQNFKSVKSLTLQTLTISYLECTAKSYYSAGNCQDCHFSCLTCNSNSLNDCLSCDGPSYRDVMAGGYCKCQAGYYDDGNSMLCQQCHVNCKTCSAGLVGNCLSCEALQLRELVAMSCTCLDGYFDDSAPLCQKCNPLCLTCSAGSTSSCTSCDALQFRTIDGGICKCKEKYYSDVTQTCQACPQICETCTGNQTNNCSSCDVLKFRELANNECTCKIGYFDDGSLTCSSCNPKCKSCSGSSSNNCQTCHADQFRQLDVSKCVCTEHYFDDGSLVCQKCHPTCFTCSGAAASECISCSVDQLREYANASCSCIAPYQDIGLGSCSCINDIFVEAPNCVYSCATCTGPNANDCVECNSTSKRTLSSGKCVCEDGYYDNSIVSNCSSCHGTCKSCKGPGEFECTSCPDLTVLNAKGNCEAKVVPPDPDPVLFDEIQKSQDSPDVPEKKPDTPCKQGNQPISFCVLCHPICSACTGSDPFQCTACATEHFYEIKFQTDGIALFSFDQTIQIEANFKHYLCKNGTTNELKMTQTNSFYDYKIQGQNETAFQQKNSTLLNPIIISIEPNLLSPGDNYNIILTVYGMNKQILKSESLEIKMHSVNWTAVIFGGDQRWGADTINQLRVQIENQTSIQVLGSTETYKFQWSCSDINGISCTNKYKQPITFNGSQIQYFEARMFEPYKTFVITCVTTMISSGDTRSSTVIVQVYEGSIPQLFLNYNPKIVLERMNLQEEQTLSFIYNSTLDSDQLFYSANLIYDFSIVSTIVAEYMAIKFTIWDHFEAFTRAQGEVFVFMGSVYSPLYYMPSLTSIKEFVNIPPQNCVLQITPQIGQELTDIFTAQVLNCEATPGVSLFYQFGYYLSQSDYLEDIIFSQFNNLNFITSYQEENIVQFYLPGAKGSIYFLASIQNTLGAVKNLTQSPIVRTQNLYEASKQIINSLNTDVLSLKSSLSMSLLQSLLTSPFYWITYKMDLEKTINQMKQATLNTFYAQQLIKIQALFYQCQLTDVLSTQNLQDLQFTQDQIGFELQTKSALIARKAKEGNSFQLQAQITKSNSLISHLISLAGSSITHNHVQSYSIGNLSNNSSNHTVVFKQYVDLVNKNQMLDISDSIPNQQMTHIIGDDINSKAQLVTSKKLWQLLQPTGGLNRMLIEESNTNENHGSSYVYLKVDYKSNPLTSDKYFPYPLSNFSLTSLTVKQTNGSVDDPNTLDSLPNINLTTPIKINISNAFQASIPDTKKLKCIQQQDENNWTHKTCQLYQTSNEQPFACICTNISTTSVVDDTDSEYQDDLFGDSGVQAIEQFRWYQTAIFYIIAIYSILYISLLIWGYRKDMFDMVDGHNNSIQSPVEQKEGDSNRSQEQPQKPEKVSAFRHLIGMKDESHAQSQLQSSKSYSIQFKNRDRKRQIYPIIDDQAIEISSVDPSERTKDFNQEISKIQPLEVTKDIEQVKSLPFYPYLMVNHPILNIYTLYDKILSRPLRATLIFFTILQTLAVIIYFGNNLNLLETALLIFISTIGSNATLFIMRIMLSSQSAVLSFFGVMCFVCLVFFYVYVILAVIAMTKTVEQANLWALQYLVSFTSEYLIFSIVRTFLKCYLANLVLKNENSCLASLLKKTVFAGPHMELIKSLLV